MQIPMEIVSVENGAKLNVMKCRHHKTIQSPMQRLVVIHGLNEVKVYYLSLGFRK